MTYKSHYKFNSTKFDIDTYKFPIVRTSDDKDLSTKVRALLKYDDDGKCNNIFAVLSRVESLSDAYETIKNKSGNMVPGSTEETLDGISREWFKETAHKLTSESFSPAPSRRVYIPKANGKMRPLGIGSPRDKIIQQSMRIALEMILEPKFLNSSHGFRPKRGCHTALSQVRSWSGVKWLIEGDIKGFFDAIDHQILAQLLQRHIRDKRFMNLYWKFVRAGYIEFENKSLMETHVGVPQGGIISPLLSNLVLHELDVFVDQIKKQSDADHSNIPPEVPNPKYRSLTNAIYYLNRKLAKGCASPQDLSRRTAIIKERRRTPPRSPHPDYCHYEYVRYADDWLIGVWGGKSSATQLKDNIRIFLHSLKLELSVEKTLITNTRSDRAKFLGVYIKRAISNHSQSVRKGRRHSDGSLQMTLSIPDIVQKLMERKYLIVQNNRWIPLSFNRIIPLPIKEMILKYRTILRGFSNYYSFTDNIQNLNKVFWILWESLRKTICRKLKYGKRDFLAAFGKNIAIKIRKRDGETVILDFKKPLFERIPFAFMDIEKLGDPLAARNWKISTISALGQACSNCGNNHSVEMHHLKHLRTLNLKLSGFDQLMARINRKQVPLCKKCHDQVHNGDHVGMSLRYFHHIRWEGEGKWT